MRQFKDRHIGITLSDKEAMLEKIGINSVDDLIDQVIPKNIRLDKKLNITKPLSEIEYLQHMRELGSKNKVAKSFIGQGYNTTHTPSVIRRTIFENPAWYTAYTPYQAEIAQGRLEALLNFQTMIIELTGMEIANSSLLDEATAASEAMILSYNTREKKDKQHKVKFLLDPNCFLQTKLQVRSRARFLDIEVVEKPYHQVSEFTDFFGALVQYPNAEGSIENYSQLSKLLKQSDAKLIVAADILALTILTPPGVFGADVVVGSTQRFGVPMGFGGPSAAYFATKKIYKRSVPGRIIGVSIDAHNKPALRMALQTREQHIKRDRATSNICTSQVLLAVMAGMYAVYHGKTGLLDIASYINILTTKLYKALKHMGQEVKNNTFFDTLTVELTNEKLSNLKQYAEDKNINFFYTDSTVSINIGQLATLEDIKEIADLFARISASDVVIETAQCCSNIPKELRRTTDFLTSEVFLAYSSETQIMRYIRRLESKDISLVHSMIPLGSCTMKLNATSELIPLSDPLWANIHPFAPSQQVEGYLTMLKHLEQDLCSITGFHKVTLQPNSGAQGEYTGLYAIRMYQKSQGQEKRNIALIPTSAHGTNPASAVMAGLKVILVKCDEKGNIDIDNLKEKAEEHAEYLSCLMITYPSTHGVYEEGILEVTEIIHSNGGQVYMDGANMNAQVGLTNPAKIGADVCHLNLHKTFAIPHGGGGPGVGPIGVAKHLSPFLPSNPHNCTEDLSNGEYTISASNYGSALVSMISYGYIKMLGEEGLIESTKSAILNANYMKELLSDSYDILYTNEKGRVAHEMILDCRKFKQMAKIEVVDIAKRLIDYEFHAPTVSFPVNGTLMVEPTESEDKEELDRFIFVMKKIRKEIDYIAKTQELENNVLKNAPHTLSQLIVKDWDRPYSREVAAFPLNKEAKNYWPPVSRVNDAYGDRNLVCSCLPVEMYQE